MGPWIGRAQPSPLPARATVRTTPGVLHPQRQPPTDALAPSADGQIWEVFIDGDDPDTL